MIHIVREKRIELAGGGMTMKRILLILLLFLLFTVRVFAGEPSVAARGAALIDGETGRLLWGKNAEEPMAMASTAKIMTAILVLEHCALDEIVTVSKNAAKQPEVHMEMKEGERWRAGDLLSAMLLHSYNDAAVALAEHICGSTENFCQRMTEKAKEIGTKNSVFGSPNGLDSHLAEDAHYSTAYDMALIAAYALKNEVFCEMIAQPEVYITELEGKRSIQVTNTDRFLREYSGALGVKTGYTNRAGHCFVGAAKKDGVRLISAVLGSGWGTAGKEQKWTDTKTLMGYGFDTFQPYRAIQKGTVFGEVSVEDSPTESVETIFATDYQALFSEEERAALTLSVEIPKQVEAPVQAGQRLGKAILFLKEEALAEIDLLARQEAERYTLMERLGNLREKWIAWRRF